MSEDRLCEVCQEPCGEKAKTCSGKCRIKKARLVKQGQWDAHVARLVEARELARYQAGEIDSAGVPLEVQEMPPAEVPPVVVDSGNVKDFETVPIVTAADIAQLGKGPLVKRREPDNVYAQVLTPPVAKVPRQEPAPELPVIPAGSTPVRRGPVLTAPVARGRVIQPTFKE